MPSKDLYVAKFRRTEDHGGYRKYIVCEECLRTPWEDWQLIESELTTGDRCEICFSTFKTALTSWIENATIS